MAKRKSAEQPEIVQQLRPDDTGWLAELRRARTEPISLAPGPDDEVAQLSDPSGASGPAASERTEPPHERTEAPQSEGIDPPPSEHTGPAPGADPTPSTKADSTPSPETDPTPLAEGGASAPPPERDALPPPLLAPPAAPSHRPPSDLGVPRSTPPPATWYRATRPPARSAPPRQTRRSRGRRRNDKRHRSLLRRWDVVLPLLALVVGATIGLTWRGSGTPSSGQPVGGPGSMASLPSSSPTELPQSIVVTSIRYVGDSITLSWIDPTEGQALFVISQIISDDTDARFVRDLPAGQTEAVITGLDPNVSEYCYRVFAVQNGGAVARSATTCAQKRNPA